MAFGTFQLCLVFAIGLFHGPVYASTALSESDSLAGANTISGSSLPGVGQNSPAGATSVSAVSTGSGTSSAPAGGKIALSLLVEDPKDVTVARGQGTHLRCPVHPKGPGPTTYKISWFCDGKLINETDTRRQILDDGSLHIRKVVGKRVSSVEGSYSCAVQNRYGTIVTNQAKLRIAMLAKVFEKQPEDVRVEALQPIRLSCQIISTPPAIITWERNGNPLPHISTRYVPLPSGDLIIPMTQLSDSGSYRCKALNEISKKHRYSEEANVEIIHNTSIIRAPKFLVFSHEFNLTVQVGTSLPLYCFATGYPRPNIKWIYNAFDSNNEILSNSSILWLRNLTTDQSGVYSCRAQNSIDHINQLFHVIVVQGPYFIKTPMSQWFPSARTVRLECKAEGIPTPQIRWLKDGEPLAVGGRIKILQPSSVLLLSHTFTTDSGLYQCIAENQFGRIWSAVQLIANITGPAPVTPPINVRCKSFNRTSICLQWDVPTGIHAQAFTVHSFNADLVQEYITNNTYYLVSKLEPLTSYTFYIRLYMKAVSSDQSKKITCQTILLGNRNLNTKILSNSTVRVEWTSLSSDTPCGGIAEYKLQWRKYGHASNNAKLVFDNHYTITGLMASQKYEIRVQSPNNIEEELPWDEFVMPSSYESTELDATTSAETPKNVLAPINLEAEPLSAFNINLTWKDPRNPADVLNGGYYMICFIPVLLQQACENGYFTKSISTNIEIKKLNPFTLYEFKVRAHNLDGSYGQFSHSAECRTLEDVPEKVTNLIGKLENTSICLRWRKPVTVNGQLQRYIISYTTDQNQPLDQWPSSVLMADQAIAQSCWRSSADTVSTRLSSLKGGKMYRIVVRAATAVGLSSPSEIFKIRIPDIPTSPPRKDELPSNQKLGIIMGVCIALMLIVACISCMIFRRRCLKARARERARMYAPRTINGQNDLYCQTSAQFVQAEVALRTPCQPMSLAEERTPCEAEAHELQYLVTDTETEPHIPPVQQSHLDTKGGVTFPNGQVNGLKPTTNGHIPNGHVHITENPQFEPYNYTSLYNGNSESHQLLNVDRNSKLDDSLLDDDTFNSTQLTNLEESLVAAAAAAAAASSAVASNTGTGGTTPSGTATTATIRTLSPIIGPNG